MKTILLSCAAVLTSVLPSTQGAQLLLNGNFEAPALTTTGDHTNNQVVTSWNTATTATGANNLALNNLVRGTVTNGTGLIGNATPLPVYQNDSANGDMQSFDGSGSAVVLYQDFTMALGTTQAQVDIGFGGRDYTSAAAGTAGASWSILDPANNYAAVATLTSAVKPTTGQWTVVPTQTVTLTPGKTYRFAISLPDPDMVDGASINVAPEPSTYAGVGLGLGLLAWLQVKRCRRIS